MKRVVLLFVCLFFVLSGTMTYAARKEKPASAQPALVASYGDWSVYHTGSGKIKICYMFTQPKSRTPNNPKFGQAYAFVSRRPAEHVHNEISFVMGFNIASAKSKQEPMLILGHEKFVLLPKGNDLWIKNAQDEDVVIAAMRKGALLTLKAPAKGVGLTISTYSLKGFNKALDRERKECIEK